MSLVAGRLRPRGRTGLCRASRPVGILLFSKFCRSVNTCSFFESVIPVVSNVCVFCVHSSEGRKEAEPPSEWELATAGRSGSFFFFSGVHRFFQATDD